MAAGLFLLARARAYPGALAAVLLLGAAWALLINVANVLTPPAFADGPDALAFATNLANAVFGLGAFLTPLLVSPLVRRASLSAALNLLVLLALTPALLSLGVDFAALSPAAPPGATDTPSPAAGIGALLANPVVWLCGLALFFYGPLEASLAAWATTLLGERGLNEAAAARVLSGFWLAYLLSRLATALTLPPGWEGGLTLALAVACVGILLGLVFSRGRAPAAALVLAAGLAFGPIFPTVLAILLGHSPASLHGRAVGLFFAVGGVGWTVIPILLGAYASRTSVQRGFLVAAGAAVGLASVAGLLLVSERAW
jgi:fucose permease